MLDLLLNHVLCHVVCSTAVESAAFTINALNNRVNFTRPAAEADDDGSGGSDGSGSDNRLRFNTAVVTSADLMATDGVVHIIDQVVVPTDGLSSPACLCA